MMFRELPEPVPDTGATRPQIASNCGDRSALRRQKDHPDATVQAGLPALPTKDRLDVPPFLSGESQFHANSIGKGL